MLYKSGAAERNAAMHVAELMTAAARTAPKGRGVDTIETLILDGEDKDKLVSAMREWGDRLKMPFFHRDAINIDACHCVVLIGAEVKPRSLNCAFCGTENCAEAAKGNIACAIAVSDLGIAVGSAAAMAGDSRIDTRVMFSVGVAAMKLKLLSDKVTICYGLGLSVSGKSIFFDRPVTQ
jgi:uncharacterized ferredoxin-like protein